MAVAIESHVKKQLGPFHNAILDVVHGGWSDWEASSHKAQIRYRRTRANMVHDFMIHRAVTTFDTNPAIHIIHQDETAKFLFGREILVRFKKGDANCLGANIPTQAALAFADPQLQIPGLPDVQKIEVVYILNALETSIERVAVTARDNAIRMWSYDIENQAATSVVPLLPVAPTPITGANVVRLRHTSQQLASSDSDKNSG